MIVVVVVVVVVVVIAKLVVVPAVVKGSGAVVVDEEATVVSAAPAVHDVANRRTAINEGKRRIQETLRLRGNCADVAGDRTGIVREVLGAIRLRSGFGRCQKANYATVNRLGVSLTELT